MIDKRFQIPPGGRPRRRFTPQACQTVIVRAIIRAPAIVFAAADILAQAIILGLAIASAPAIILAPAIALAQPAAARQSSTTISTAEFRERLDRHLADTSLRRSLVGVSIVRARDSMVIAERNASALLHPGSNMKLFTTGAALAILGGDFRLRTHLYCDAGIDDGDLKGNLYVVGGGDPLIDSVGIDSIAGMAAAAGIRRIEGDIVADLSLFDTLGWGRGWMWDDEPDPDEGFITPLSFDGASVAVVAGPGGKEGDTLLCAVGGSTAYFEFDNVSSTLPRGSADSVTVTRERGRDRIVVRGAMALGAPPETTVVSVRQPALYFLSELRERLRARGIETEGSTRAGRVAGPVRLGTLERELGEVLRRINKKSDNLAAEGLLKAMASRLTGEPGSADRGLEEVGNYLSGIGIDPGAMMMADGSGVSWYSAVAASDIIALLLDQRARASTFGTFYSSLPKAGCDGTLSGRMSGTAAAGRVVAKTGTLTGVSAISGYATTLSNDFVAFSIIVNHFPGRARELRDLQDAIISDLVLLDAGR